MTSPPHAPHARFVGNLLKELRNRGWQLDRDAAPDDPGQGVGRLLERILAGDAADRHPVRPLPAWLVDTFQSGGSASLASCLSHDETWRDIMDSMVLWLDFDALRDMEPDGQQEVFRQRQTELRDNAFYRYLVGLKSVLRVENPVFQRQSALASIPLLRRLAMSGAFCLENFGTTELRDVCHAQLAARQKTRKIPDAFLRFHEAAVADPLLTHVIVVSGYYTLFFSPRDYLAELRKTTVARKVLENLENSTLQEMTEHFRGNFIKGIAMNSPSSHYRHDRIMQPKFVATLAFVYWRDRLRRHMILEERDRQNRSSGVRPAGNDQAGEPKQTLRTRMILERIHLNSMASLELPPGNGPAPSRLACRVAGLKDRFVLLVVETTGQNCCEVALGQEMTLRFAIPAVHQGQRYYACACRPRRIKTVSDDVTALLVEPHGDLVSLDRKYPRIPARVLSIRSADIWLGIREAPIHPEALGAPDIPDATAPPAPVWLVDISSGGAGLGLDPNIQGRLEALHAARAAPAGLLRLSLPAFPQRRDTILLTFRLTAPRQGPDGPRVGAQFLAEAEQSVSGRLTWSPIIGQGCHELSSMVFTALLKRRA